MSADPNSGRRPVFVERRTYRYRRLVDAARLLPVLAVALMCLPLLWGGDRTTPTMTTYTMTYVFGLWLALVVTTAILSRRLRNTGPVNTVHRDEDGPSGEA